jgi:hypothetical protein
MPARDGLLQPLLSRLGCPALAEPVADAEVRLDGAVLAEHRVHDPARHATAPEAASSVVVPGARLFENGTGRTSLELVESQTFSMGVLNLTYRPAGDGAGQR